MNCTPLHIEKRIVYRGFCILVLISLLIYAGTAGPEHPLWDEELVSWMRKWRTQRGSRAVFAGHVVAHRVVGAKDRAHRVGHGRLCANCRTNVGYSGQVSLAK